MTFNTNVMIIKLLKKIYVYVLTYLRYFGIAVMLGS